MSSKSRHKIVEDTKYIMDISETDNTYNENCKKSMRLIKQREKAKRDADRYYTRHRSKVLERHRVAAANGAALPHASLRSASEASSICNVYSVMETVTNPVVSFD